MNSTPKISIIIPVYNVEKYLKKCIESILNQTFTNYEIILIDDGSTDNSKNICDEFSYKDSRIKVIHKNNTGAADSRNIGISLASGEYIGFVDSDDYIDPDMYESLYNLITKYKTDVAICGLLHEYPDKTINPYPAEEERSVSGKEALKIALIGDKFSLNVYNKIYKKEMFNYIKFPNLKFAEDAYVVTRILYNSDSVAYSTSPKYHWVHHFGSITTSNFDSKDWQVVKVYTENLEFIKNNCPELIKESTCRYYLAYFWVIDKMATSNSFILKSEINFALKTLRKGYIKILLNPYFNYKRKLSATVLLFSWRLYKLIIKRYKN